MAREEIELEVTNQRVAATRERGRKSTGASQCECTILILISAPISISEHFGVVAMKATITHPIVWIFAAFLCLYNGVSPHTNVL